MSIKRGDNAAEFQLYASDKTVVSLHDYNNRNVILLFFPLAFSSTCTTELCQIRDELTVYNDLNCDVLGISVDSLYTLAVFKDSYNLNFPLLSDFNKEVSRAYGALYEEWAFGMRGVGKRATFLIDKTGVVRYVEVLENASQLPDFRAVTKALYRLK